MKQTMHWSSPENINLGGYMQDSCLMDYYNHEMNGFKKIIFTRVKGSLIKPLFRVIDIIAHSVLGAIKIVNGISFLQVIKVWNWYRGKENHYNWTFTEGIHHFVMVYFFVFDIPLSIGINMVDPSLYFKLIYVNKKEILKYKILEEINNLNNKISGFDKLHYKIIGIEENINKLNEKA